jgi:hypothetical protein
MLLGDARLETKVETCPLKSPTLRGLSARNACGPPTPRLTQVDTGGPRAVASWLCAIRASSPETSLPHRFKSRAGFDAYLEVRLG